MLALVRVSFFDKVLYARRKMSSTRWQVGLRMLFGLLVILLKVWLLVAPHLLLPPCLSQHPTTPPCGLSYHLSKPLRHPH